MATLQELETPQINELIDAAVRKTVPVTATLRIADGWRTLRSRFLAARDQHVLVEMPVDREGRGAPELSPADKLGISFKLKHHKHLFTSTVAGTGRVACEGGDGQEVLVLCFPTRMQRLQRRAFVRVGVPAGRIVRASFWLGGQEAEPAGTSPERPVWSGRVTNLSAGGFQLDCDVEPVESLDVGETVGVRVCFGAGEEAIFADAQFRHADVSGDRVALGFQFMGLALSAQGRQALSRISVKVAELQHISTRPARQRMRA